MTKINRTTKLLATVAAGTLVFAACGSDDGTPTNDDPVDAPVSTDPVTTDEAPVST